MSSLSQASDSVAPFAPSGTEVTASTAETPRDANGTAKSAPGPHLAAIDGLRGLAALVIVVYHLYNSCNAPEWRPIHHVNLFRPLTDGVYAVHLFFVLSGFCLAWPYAQKPQRLFVWRQFMERRTRRIVPAYYVSLLLVPLLYLGLGQFVHKDLFNHPAGKLDVLLHLTFTHGLWSRSFHTINGVYWTLSIEWLWYLAFPFCLFLFRKWGLNAGFLGLLAVTLLFRAMMWHYYQPLPGSSADQEINRWQVASDSLPSLLFLFGMGMWVAFYWSQPGRKPLPVSIVRLAPFIVIVLLIMGRMAEGASLIFPLRETFFGLAFSFLVMMGSAPQANLIQSIFASRPLVFTGTVSYSLYLYHLPFCVALGTALKQQFPGGVSPGTYVIAQACLSGPILLLSWFMYTVVEKPFLAASAAKKKAV